METERRGEEWWGGRKDGTESGRLAVNVPLNVLFKAYWLILLVFAFVCRHFRVTPLQQRHQLSPFRTSLSLLLLLSPSLPPPDPTARYLERLDRADIPTPQHVDASLPILPPGLRRGAGPVFGEYQESGRDNDVRVHLGCD